jgi:hypothetical protein
MDFAPRIRKYRVLRDIRLDGGGVCPAGSIVEVDLDANPQQTLCSYIYHSSSMARVSDDAVVTHGGK